MVWDARTVTKRFPARTSAETRLTANGPSRSSVAVWARVRAVERRREIEAICEYFSQVNALRRFPEADVPVVLQAGLLKAKILGAPPGWCGTRGRSRSASPR